MLVKIKGNLPENLVCPTLKQALLFSISTDSIGRRVKSVGIKLALRLNAIPSSISLESWGTVASIKKIFPTDISHNVLVENSFPWKMGNEILWKKIRLTEA